MKRWKTVLIHVLGWTGFFGYTYTAWLNRTTDPVTIWLSVSMSVARLAVFYACYAVAFPRYLTRSKAPQLILSVVAAYLLFAGVRALLEEVIYPALLGFDNYRDASVAYYLLDNLYYGVPFIILAAAVYAMRHAYRQEQQHALLKEEANRAELAFLKSQINPHFLYNTLNYLYALAIPVSGKLAGAIVNLSDLMRYTLSESKDGKVGIDREIQYIRNYIALFRLRLEPAFYVNFDVSGEQEQRVAPLLLIPFVENALKHGVVNKADHPVTISLALRGQMLEFRTQNLVNRHQKDISGGIGLVNVQRRLQLIYPGRHTLTIDRQRDVYHVHLRIHL